MKVLAGELPWITQRRRLASQLHPSIPQNRPLLELSWYLYLYLYLCVLPAVGHNDKNKQLEKRRHAGPKVQ